MKHQKLIKKTSDLIPVCRFIAALSSLFFARVTVLMIKMFYAIGRSYYDIHPIQWSLLINYIIWSALMIILGLLVHKIRFFIEDNKLYIVRMPIILLEYCIPISNVKAVHYQYKEHYSMGTISSHKENDIKYYIVTVDNQYVDTDRLLWNQNKIISINTAIKRLKKKLIKNCPEGIRKAQKSTTLTTTFCIEPIFIFLFCAVFFAITSNIF